VRGRHAVKVITFPPIGWGLAGDDGSDEFSDLPDLPLWNRADGPGRGPSVEPQAVPCAQTQPCVSSIITFNSGEPLMRHLVAIAVVAFGVFGSLSAQGQQPAPKFSIPALVKEMSPGVVNITVLNQAGKPTGYGSGFVVNSSGTIVTAFHVIKGAAGAMVKTVDGEIYDRVEVVQYDLRRDIAVLKIQPFRALTALRLAEEEQLPIGEDTAAIGNPQGLEASVSAGIISGYRQAEGYRMIQTTAAVSPGSSGGPLFDMSGGVIGMVTSAVDNTRAQNLNFAIPVIYIRTLLMTETQPTPLGDFTKRVASSPLAALRPVAAGDSDEWTVRHAHGSFEDGCEGVLTLANGRLIFSGSVLSHTFDVPVTSVADVAQNAAIGRSWYAFHIRFANNVIYNFAVVDENHRPQQPGSLIYRIAAAKRGQ